MLPLLVRGRVGLARYPAMVRRGLATLDTPFISDTIPLAEGRLGTVAELLADVGQRVDENDVVAVVETDKVSLDVKASQSGVVKAVLVEIGDEINERQALFELEE
jgi:pyruvate carboxylase